MFLLLREYLFISLNEQIVLSLSTNTAELW
jgi:hypothetical protein